MPDLDGNQFLDTDGNRLLDADGNLACNCCNCCVDYGTRTFALDFDVSCVNGPATFEHVSLIISGGGPSCIYNEDPIGTLICDLGSVLLRTTTSLVNPGGGLPCYWRIEFLIGISSSIICVATSATPDSPVGTYADGSTGFASIAITNVVIS